MGRLVSLILLLPRLMLAVFSGIVVACLGGAAGLFGCEVRPQRRPEDKEPLTKDAEESHPESNHDDEIRRWLDDKSPAARLELAHAIFNRQAAEVGVLIDDPINVWAEKRELKRKEAELAALN